MKKFNYLLLAVLAAGSLTGCSTNEKEPVTDDNQTEENQELEGNIAVGPDIVTEKLGDAVVAVRDSLGEGYLPNTPLYLEQLEEIYGINPTDVKQFIGEVPMIGMHPDVFIAIEANDGAVENIETALNTYKDYLINDAMQYPMNLPKIQTTQVVTYGNYVFLVLLGAPNDNMDATDEEGAIFAAAESQKALDALASVFE